MLVSYPLAAGGQTLPIDYVRPQLLRQRREADALSTEKKPSHKERKARDDLPVLLHEDHVPIVPPAGGIQPPRCAENADVRVLLAEGHVFLFAGHSDNCLCTVTTLSKSLWYSFPVFSWVYS